MYKGDEEYTGAKTYVINFNGPSISGTKKLLADVTPLLNGQWQKFQIDLDKAFDSVAPSDHYYIKEVRLVGTQPSETVLNRRCSSLYIDNIIGFTSFSKAPSYKSADSKTALEELQDLMDKTNHVAYIRPGMERKDDMMIVLPRQYYTIPVTVDQNNVIEVQNLEYKPLEWGLVNNAVDSYNIKDKTSVGYVKASDLESDKHYGVIMDHEFYSDVSSKASAQSSCNAKVDNEGFKNYGFDVKLQGSTLVEPGQYIQVTLPNII